MENGKGSKCVKSIFKGVLISFVSTVIFLIIFSIILTYTNIQENVINPVIIVLTAISIFIGSSIGNMKIKKNGLINGGLIGGIYMIMIYLVSSILNWEFGLDLQAIIFILVGVIFGVLGRNHRC
ncbi:MAG: TIGR04086 family membrane protein [Clostridia bacterium]|nr:TIGR04086 family membrane protein [Clostridia bacterium]